MSIRLPLQTVLSVDDTTATAGVVSKSFQIPQDTEGIVVKLYCTGFTGTNPTCDVYVQTSDDAGTTWYDCANLGQVTGTITSALARWAYFPVGGGPKRTQGASWLDIGACGASTATVTSYTGLGIISQYARIYLKYAGTQLANSGVNIRVYSCQQSATA